MVIVVVLAVVLIGVPLLLWGLNRLRSERRDRSGVADGRGSDDLVGVLFVFFTIGFGSRCRSYSSTATTPTTPSRSAASS